MTAFFPLMLSPATNISSATSPYRGFAMLLKPVVQCIDNEMPVVPPRLLVTSTATVAGVAIRMSSDLPTASGMG
jgi:hypothetical protein